MHLNSMLLQLVCIIGALQMFYDDDDDVTTDCFAVILHKSFQPDLKTNLFACCWLFVYEPLKVFYVIEL